MFTKHTLCRLLWSRVVSCLSAETFRQVYRAQYLLCRHHTCGHRPTTNIHIHAHPSRRMGVAYEQLHKHRTWRARSAHMSTSAALYARCHRVNADIWCVTNTARLNCISTCCSHSSMVHSGISLSLKGTHPELGIPL